MKLINRTNEKEVEATIGQTILDHALKEKLEWGFSCIRGTCARCRCLIVSGQNSLEPPTEEERLRLTDEELKEGYRLGCQAVIRSDQELTARWKPYF